MENNEFKPEYVAIEDVGGLSRKNLVVLFEYLRGTESNLSDDEEWDISRMYDYVHYIVTEEHRIAMIQAQLNEADSKIRDFVRKWLKDRNEG